ncbi:TIGR00366 family protein, partial [Actinoplanes cyaneus]|uniref:TIGR00366 family protein n=1 Tax=Actinoplanes cyaneus TaxID=52696 RepID=UPI0031CEE758
PLWQLVRFADGVPEAEAAGIEAALHAAGLLDAWLHPESDEVAEQDAYLRAGPPAPGATLTAVLVPEDQRLVPAARITAALTGIALTISAFVTQGLDALNLNVLNFGFIALGLALYTSPIDYLREFYEAVESSAGIILQFPFYAGIIGIMTGTGLVDTITEFLLSIAT